MSIVEISDKSILEPLFSGWEETMIWSCLQGIMGRAYGNDGEKPQSAQVVLGDFCFFSGKPDKELIRNKPSGRKSDFIIMVPRDSQWASAIEEVSANSPCAPTVRGKRGQNKALSWLKLSLFLYGQRLF